jgi:phosphoglycolate phosphatase
MAFPTFEDERIKKWVGNGAQVLVQRGLSGSSEIDNRLDSALVKQCLERFLHHYEQRICVKTRLYDGVKTTLKKLKQQGYSLNIITNKPEKFIAPILRSLDIEGLFSVMLGGDSLAEKKPSPSPLLHAMSLLNVTSPESMMIGDSGNDIKAAHAANVDSVGLTYGYSQGQDIRIHKPTYVLDRFEDLSTIL